jgi:predicted DNA-binding protein with PD1-like motif
MSIQKLFTSTAIAAVAVMAFGAGSASATTALRLDPGGTFTGATTISNTTAHHATIVTNIGTITCRETRFSADVNSHTSATSITGKLTSLTLTSCTDTIAPLNYTDCALHAGSPLPTVHILGTSSAGGTATVNGVVWRCAIQGSTTSFCYLSQNGAWNGSVANATSSITFSNLSAVSSAPTTDAFAAGLCGATATFSTTLTHIVQTSTNRTVTVTN